MHRQYHLLRPTHAGEPVADEGYFFVWSYTLFPLYSPLGRFALHGLIISSTPAPVRTHPDIYYSGQLGYLCVDSLSQDQPRPCLQEPPPKFTFLQAKTANLSHFCRQKGIYAPLLTGPDSPGSIKSTSLSVKYRGTLLMIDVLS